MLVTDKELEEAARQMGIDQEAAETLRRAMELRKVSIIFVLLTGLLIALLEKAPW
jgi:hypothetical protein